MDCHAVANILQGIGADKVRVTAGTKVACCCVLARWTHPKGRDNTPSMVVMEGKFGDPIYTCMACHDTGTLVDLLLFLRTRGHHEVVPWLHALEGLRPVEGITKAERLKQRSKEVSAFGSSAPTQQASLRAPEVRKAFDDGRPFYDYQALAKAEAVEEIPAEEYEPYAGSVPSYALDRGLTIETCKAFELGNDKGMQRLLFPVRDRKGRLVAISGRLYATACLRCRGEWERRCRRCEELEGFHELVDDDERICADGEPWEPQRPECVDCGLPQPPKYLHNKGFKRNLVLYGEHMKDEAKDGRVYVVEGHLDMIRMWQAGYRPVVAMLGSHPGTPQIEKLIKHWKKVVVVGDGNVAGRDMAQRVKKMVADRIPVSIRDLDDGKDPGNMTPEELKEKLGHTPSLT